MPTHYIFFRVFGLLHLNKLVSMACDSEKRLPNLCCCRLLVRNILLVKHWLLKHISRHENIILFLSVDNSFGDISSHSTKFYSQSLFLSVSLSLAYKNYLNDQMGKIIERCSLPDTFLCISCATGFQATANMNGSWNKCFVFGPVQLHLVYSLEICCCKEKKQERIWEYKDMSTHMYIHIYWSA